MLSLMNKKKTILIAGGAGFIGSHLCEKYLALGHKVICVDNLQTTIVPKNIERFFTNKNFKFIKQDIIDPLKIPEKIDWIFNAACSGSYTSYQYDPIHTIKTNTIGVINLLELAKKNNARIMQFSTSEIYGDPLQTPQKESYRGNVNPIGPRACYDEGKRCAETLFFDYHREYGVDVKVIRIFNTYGPNMDINDGRAVTNFIVNALNDDDIIIYGDGKQTRSFQYIDDLVGGIDKMMRKEGFAGPVNLGNPNEISIKDLAEIIIKKTNSRSKIIFEEQATDDPKRRCPDISLAKKELGWEPNITLEEGLEKTIEYFKTIEHPSKKILVFATTYYPHIGPAENALFELSKSMPKTEFHIITTKFQKNLKRKEKIGNTTIYRIGFGSKLDKFLLPFLGFKKAKDLNKKHKFRFVWSIMASYGAIPAIFLKQKNKNLSFLLTLDEKELKQKSKLKKKVVSFFHRIAFKHADSVYTQNEENLNIEKNKLVNLSQKESFTNTVQKTYKELLNKQERKLKRAK